MIYYFAYGTDLNGRRMDVCCPDAKRIGIGCITDYRIDFTLGSKNKKGGIEDIKESKGDIVWGVIYNVSTSDIATLDHLHGYPDSYNRKRIHCRKFHFPQDFDRLSEDHTDIEQEAVYNNPLNYTDIDVIVYSATNKSSKTIRPSIYYLQTLQEAAEDNHFPMSYQRILNDFGTEIRKELNSKALDFILSVFEQVQREDFKEIVKDIDEFGGAQLVITGSKERKKQLNQRYPSDLVVLTNYWKELSWVVLQIYNDASTNWQFNNMNKYIYFKEFGEALLEYQKNHPNDPSHVGICQAGITRAYAMLTEGGELFVD